MLCFNFFEIFSTEKLVFGYAPIIRPTEFLESVFLIFGDKLSHFQKSSVKLFQLSYTFHKKVVATSLPIVGVLLTNNNFFKTS